MRNSDDYLAVLIAAGPGLVPAAAWWAYETAFDPQAEPGVWLYAYPLFLLASCPGLPVLGFLLAKGLTVDQSGLHVRQVSLFASVVLPLWHFLLLDVSLRIFGDSQAVPWILLARFAAVIWITTAACWILYRRRQGHDLSSSAPAAD